MPKIISWCNIMNIVKEQMFVNLIAKQVDLIKTENLNINCSQLIFHLKYNKCLSKLGEDYIISEVPDELLHIKKFIRKITYFTIPRKFVFYPNNQDINNITIYK
jgi:hypothetical protein